MNRMGAREGKEREGNGFSPPFALWPKNTRNKKTHTQKTLQAKLSRNEVLWIQRVYSGETLKGRTPSLQEACAPGGKTPPPLALPTLEEFRHLTAVVASYAFHLPDDEGTDRTVMLPLLDLVNHANAGVANAVVAREGEEFTARALRDIREGEEVRFFCAFVGFSSALLFTGTRRRCCPDPENSNLPPGVPALLTSPSRLLRSNEAHWHLGRNGKIQWKKDLGVAVVSSSA